MCLCDVLAYESRGDIMVGMNNGVRSGGPVSVDWGSWGEVIRGWKVEHSCRLTGC